MRHACQTKECDAVHTWTKGITWSRSNVRSDKTLYSYHSSARVQYTHSKQLTQRSPSIPETPSCTHSPIHEPTCLIHTERLAQDPISKPSPLLPTPLKHPPVLLQTRHLPPRTTLQCALDLLLHSHRIPMRIFFAQQLDDLIFLFCTTSSALPLHNTLHNNHGDLRTNLLIGLPHLRQMLVHATRRIYFILALLIALDQFVVHGLWEECCGVGAHDGWGGGAAGAGVEESAARGRRPGRAI
jgi:hypothetical protein